MNAVIHTPKADHSASEALGLWEPTRTLTLEAAHKHTARVKLIRLVLIALSAVIIATVIFNVATRPDIGALADNPAESVKMISPQYSGRTDDGLPFYLTAESATRTLANKDEVELIKPVLEFVRGEGTESSSVVAMTGTYNDVDKILNLSENVSLETDDGYACETSAARIFAREKRILGNVPIACDGGFGKINGTTYAIEDSYKTFIFDGGMDAVISRDADATPNGSRVNTFGFSGDGPIDVTAKKAIYRGGTTELEGDVRVLQDGAELESNSMTILRESKTGNDTGSLKLGAIKEIIAEDKFHYKAQNNDVRGNKGVYTASNSTINVTGKVKVKQANGNNVASERLIYNTKTNAIAFSGECSGNNCPSVGRTKTVITSKRN